MLHVYKKHVNIDTMEKNELLDLLWEKYVALTPSAELISQLFEQRGEKVKNDHIALRTFDDKRVDIDVISIPFLKMGYVKKGEYEFKEKKLFAQHYEHQADSSAPKIFISQLLLGQCSIDLQRIVSGVLDQVSHSELHPDSLMLKGRLWDISMEEYDVLLKESEYASWMYIFGFCANHFTVLVNELKTLNSLEEVNFLLKNNGFNLNDAGGEIKGSPEEYLEQSSTIADQIQISFGVNSKKIPSCYYEFARRYQLPDGSLYQGFIAASADKIFESTNVSLVDKILSKSK